MRAPSRVLVVACGVGLAVTIGACDPALAPRPPPPDPAFVHIGLLNPFSGREAARALDFQNAARLAVAEINQAGGINGKQLDVIARDSKTAEPEGVAVSIAAVDELAADGAVAIVGPDSSALVLGIKDTLVADGVPLVSATASAAVLTTLDDHDLIWRTCASDNVQGAVLAARMRRDQVQTIAIVHRDDAYGSGLAATIGRELGKAGGTVLADVPYPSEKLTDFAPQVDQALADGVPDAIVVIGFSLDSAGVLTALAERAPSPRPTLYGVDGNTNQAFLDNAPPAMVTGMFSITPSSPPDNPNLGRFADAYRAKLGVDPFRTEFTYDAIYLIALAMVQAGDDSAQAVHDHLREVSRPDGATPVAIGVGVDQLAAAAAHRGADLDFHGASGAIDFDDAGDVTAATFAIREVQAGPDGLVYVDLEKISVP
jgi:branched-chain amino acid transport system substrate-binding protein